MPKVVSEGLTPKQRTQRARLAAHELHARGGTNTAPARAALAKKFLDDVDPDRVLPEDERLRRAEHARKAHYTRLSFEASKARQRKAAAAR